MKHLQARVKKFCEENKLISGSENCALDLVAEIGEVCKELLKMNDYGRGKSEYREEVAEELGDALYSLITLANSLNVNLEEELNKVLEKYNNRLKEKGNAGS